MSSELKIQDMGVKKSGHPLKHSFLPSLPMRMLVVAPSNGGKSNLLKNMLLRPEFGYRDYFTDKKTGALNYFVFSRTTGNQNSVLVPLSVSFPYCTTPNESNPAPVP